MFRDDHHAHHHAPWLSPMRWLALWAIFLIAGMAIPQHGWAQIAAPVAGVTIDKDATRQGLGLVIRPGQWAPVQVSLNNPLSTPIEVRLELLVPDADREQVHYTRHLTLTPGRDSQQTWMYAVTPQSRTNATWRLQLFDDKTGQLLDHQDIQPGLNQLEPATGAIGVLGQAMMGLEPYTDPQTRHESIRIIRGLSLQTLPDRWYGLSMLSTLIWTPAVDPASNQLTAQQIAAITQWVRRGGHLVVILPAIGSNWESSPLASLLPQTTQEVRSDVQPLFLGAMKQVPDEHTAMTMRVFTPGPEAQPILFHEGRPWIVARRMGQGRVTMIGVDLSDSRLARLGLPGTGRWTLWNDILGWRSPALSPAYVKAEVDASRMNQPSSRSVINAGQFIPQRIAMRDTAGPALILAMALFILYWIAAGPLSHFILSQKKKTHHAWLLFVGVVAMFALVAWVGAWFLRPTHAQIRHFSVVTATQGQDETHIHSWLSLYVPSHGQLATTLLQPQDAAPHSTATAADHHQDIIWSTGFDTQATAAFPDTRSYRLDLDHTDQVAFAYRSTAKEMELDYLGDISHWPVTTTAADASSDDDASQAITNWQPPTGRLVIRNGWPQGRLVHQLPGRLEHVSVIYNDGQRYPNGRPREPWFWLYRDAWEPGKPLAFTGRPVHVQPLVTGNDPVWAGRLADLTRRFHNDSRAELNEILTFFDMLPPPDYMDVTYTVDVRSYQRPLGRELDLTPMTAFKGLIIIGHLNNSPLPAPLALDGQMLPSRGDTVIRWIIPLE